MSTSLTNRDPRNLRRPISCCNSVRTMKIALTITALLFAIVLTNQPVVAQEHVDVPLRRTILLHRLLITARLSLINRRALLIRQNRPRRLPRRLLHLPTRTVSKLRATLLVRAMPNALITLKAPITPNARGIVLLANAIIIDARLDIGATAFSIGLGNTVNDLADRLSPIQREISAGQLCLPTPTRTIWEDHNGNSVRQTGGCDKKLPGKTPVRIEGISSLPATRQ